MQKHTKLYLDTLYPGWGPDDYFPCEVCGRAVTDVHHILARGMGGSNKMDYIENLMGLCRECHVTYGDHAGYKDYLLQTHLEFMEMKGITPNWDVL